MAPHRATIAPLGREHVFRVPTKQISDAARDMPAWLRSEAYVRLISFIQLCNTAVKNRKNSEYGELSPSVERILAMLNTIDAWIDEIPPLETPQRFGNRAFRTFIERLELQAEDLLSELLPEPLWPSIPELTPYLAGGFGHGVRIDYGSGHELSFVALLCCLDLIDYTDASDRRALILAVFVRYLEIVRRLQATYRLEPAGSHGVWGLDDFQFLPYYWGAHQLVGHPHLKPKSVLSDDILQHFSKDYMYLRAIQFIHEMKQGPFHEHSPLLYDISGVPTWTKVNSGMMKMYIAEVLEKFPVVQHLPFGSLLPFAQSDAFVPAPGRQDRQ
ncbi:hypothetical protein CXG81DRAFT_11622 [Caulochytrium protostelioides]|uniref:Serine/threonine-protein phosphatase 2A activator n=1 Tax=Caulochytrium protostelioides TaxID=1555241 RepID=A0A4P9X8V3_9FUNG|nr:hypothetical protein CXG81DRAFT_11622 [Caulochytrium protostelioides]|eukprot:RKP01744.1 hypothetical protein CXG81DRAFT_11622 [Caulochytrium protostelioides]